MTSKLAALCLGLAVTAGAYKVGSHPAPLVPDLDVTQPEVGPPPDTTIGSVLPLCCAECQCKPTCQCSTAKECLSPRAGTPATAPPAPPQPPSSNEAQGVSFNPPAPIAKASVAVSTLVNRPWYELRGGQWHYIGHRPTPVDAPGIQVQPVQAAPPPRYQPQRWQPTFRSRRGFCVGGNCG